MGQDERRLRQVFVEEDPRTGYHKEITIETHRDGVQVVSTRLCKRDSRLSWSGVLGEAIFPEDREAI